MYERFYKYKDLARIKKLMAVEKKDKKTRKMFNFEKVVNAIGDRMILKKVRKFLWRNIIMYIKLIKKPRNNLI